MPGAGAAASRSAPAAQRGAALRGEGRRQGRGAGAGCGRRRCVRLGRYPGRVLYADCTKTLPARIDAQQLAEARRQLLRLMAEGVPLRRGLVAAQVRIDQGWWYNASGAWFEVQVDLGA